MGAVDQVDCDLDWHVRPQSARWGELNADRWERINASFKCAQLVLCFGDRLDADAE
jgi:hypothetical protein